jgi:hypothetical protein
MYSSEIKGLDMLMKISTKGRYAVDVMLDMALNNTGEYITLKTIAERQGLSEKYLEQIVSILNKAGFMGRKLLSRNKALFAATIENFANQSA